MTSPERHRAQQLLRAKESREQRAALLLGEAQRALKDSEARLETLLRWKQDYSQQQTKLRQVRHVGVLNDWRAFLDGLEDQRLRAQQELGGLRAAVEERRRQYLACLQERKMADRYREHILAAEAELGRKREQRVADELAAQRSTRKER
ncbi:MAG: flagellar export protein FliJ [Pseudomonadales bacterium]